MGTWRGLGQFPKQSHTMECETGSGRDRRAPVGPFGAVLFITPLKNQESVVAAPESFGSAPGDPPNSCQGVCMVGIPNPGFPGFPCPGLVIPSPLPCSLGKFPQDLSTSPRRFFWIPIPDLKLQVVFQPRKS